jgi:AcrR family transcriptional regulator
MPLPNARDALLQSAERCISDLGIHNAGVDRIAENAGLSKRTLYNHFASKDEIITETLRRRAAAALIKLEEALSINSSPIADRLSVLVTSAESLALSARTSCAAVMRVGVELYATPGHPAHAVIVDFRKGMTSAIGRRLANGVSSRHERASIITDVCWGHFISASGATASAVIANLVRSLADPAYSCSAPDGQR